ncbi:MAG TPA: PhaM family polyhydroxyalkanoate granule multifunctional regulatory protein [Noviherbaspirillum sp.]|uniref:PhaM family polyhydroxyalkanoate granule multifunctional regulatory protein n=1 Tax=Noviherbaspirillum sp. TaxID=1926288 RepID=UPI002D7131FF|nr:PhaM family polyhydroxyalkanoate granule multifunctional regulatory protein [Noviherbaspirillum sp.]HYD96514.1 PhaM family polyhydroxyalkanoate granule multifunctional regulatory protein [Noviherbaspirillum sp.]
MMKPNLPNMPSIPGIGAMTDTLDFVKNLWGSMGLPGMNMPGMTGMNVPGIPGMVMPTLSVDEVNKQISDLKAVETWLNLNMGMLRSTIQALEVQAATIATLQTMGEQFTATMSSMTQDTSRAAASPANGTSTGNGASQGSNGADSHGATRAHAPAPEPTSKDEQDAASLTAPLVNAAAWWNMLQDQFKQAVSGAMTEPPAAPAAKPKAKPAAKSASKPAAKSKTSSSSSASSSARKRKSGSK